jgi:hypothetical protein
MARGALGGVPPSSPRHTRGYETRFHKEPPMARGAVGGVPPSPPRHTPRMKLGVS